MDPHRPDPEPSSSPAPRARLAAVPPITPLREALASGDWYDSLVRDLAIVVGGIDALETLDADPHADEPFDWAAVADGDRAFVQDVLSATDRCCDEWLDAEYRTIVRRLLALVAANDPRPLRRRTSPTRFGAGLVWAVLQGNGTVSRRAPIQGQDVWCWFHVATSCAGLGRGALAAAGLGVADPGSTWCFVLPPGQLVLGDTAVLHSRFRAQLLARRGDIERIIEKQLEQQAAARSIVDAGHGRVELRARPVEMRWAVKGMTTAGRAQVIIAFGESDHDPELLALTVPQAHQLRNALQEALDSSLLARGR